MPHKEVVEFDVYSITELPKHPSDAIGGGGGDMVCDEPHDTNEFSGTLESAGGLVS